MTQEEINEVAMQMILHAGNGRNLIKEALEKMDEDYFVEGEERLKEAKKELNLAHNAQTKVVQYSMENPVEINLLFTHAQDTLMTILSEHNIAKHLFKLYYKISKIGG
ncbi:PTS system, cellobiose-specific IIA component [Enterococcus sp. DIV0212c]|uniref:PTS lactose/cellobiose transporter subunit IIA n=1 Tax=Enterococcus sp. DIV0212c TaxID=2230867 RepID=UPI001A9AD89A|nr:PTS lactose/cellobiose transporter subunit IIA [Enterococcus sp. DIV0212c]MBO1353703.1 PTS lactose/cellobiose transporter subunit IIA [Enterococcus sp. DIV0212c]